MAQHVFNPMLERCLAVAGRQRGGRLVRFWCLTSTLSLVVMGLLLLPSLAGDVDARTLAAGGGHLLATVAWLQVTAACLLTPIAMAATLQRDADPIAWDVQRTTGLSTPSLVTGLLAGRLVPVLALVLCTLPALLLLRVAGGVPMQSILASTTIAMCVAALAAAGAVLFAAARIGVRQAIVAYLVCAAAGLAVTWGLDSATAPAMDAAGRRSLTIFTPLNPFLVLDAQLNPGSTAPSTHWWIGAPLRSFVLVTIAGLLVCWIGAMVLATRTANPVITRRETGRPPRPIDRHPIAWRESSGRPHALVADIVRWSVSALLFAGGLTLAILMVDDPLLQRVVTTLLVAAAIVLTLIATFIAASAVARERDDRTLDLLLTTPLEPLDYLRGKWLGLAMLLWPPVAAVILTAGATIVVWMALGEPATTGADATAPALPFMTAALGAMMLTLPGLVCLGIAIGLAWSVRSRRWTTAATVSLSLTVLLVGGATGLVWAIHGDLGGFGMWLMGTNPLLLPVLATSTAAALPANLAIESATLSLWIGGAMGGVLWCLAALVVVKTTAQSFTMTVRRLAGLD